MNSVLRSAAVAMLAVLAGGTPSQADEPPQVVASILPLHSIASAITKGVSDVQLLVGGAQPPHSLSLKPSQARMLNNADVVFWTGPEMETFLNKPLETEVDGRTVIAMLKEEHGDEHNDHKKADHKEGEHEEEGHDDAGNGDGEHGEGEHEHDHSDNHAWLDPEQALEAAGRLTEALVARDPGNAETYLANAAAFTRSIFDLKRRLADKLKANSDRQYIVIHDAYAPFAERVGLQEAVNVGDHEEVRPSAARIRQVQTIMADRSISCIITEVDTDPDLVAAVTEGRPATISMADPLGTTIEPGPDHYVALMDDLGTAFAQCLGAKHN